jgi:hypothetical protein
MKKLLLILALLSPLNAATVSRVIFKTSCDYFIVSNSQGLAVLEWYSGAEPDKDDILVGNVNSYGFKDILDETKGETLHVYVEDYSLSSDRALEIIADHCD